jgi:uncharacterized protein (DUF1778 family)
MPRNKRAALFVRCTEEEAERIRKAARGERRTVSGYVLNAVFNRLEMRDRLIAGAREPARAPFPRREE